VIAGVHLLDIGLRPRSSSTSEHVEIDGAPAPAAVEAAATGMVDALASAEARIGALVAEAAALDERAAALALAEAEIAVARAELERREERVEEAQRALDEQTRELEGRAARMRWRWLVRAWRWRPPRPHGSARTCALFFVPSPGGYKLLEHDGVAVTPSARISGLLGEDRRYVVTKLAPWPFDDRWCAYLQEDHTAAEGDTRR
jgi:FtsZ-binding cell division protein ZapB